MSAPEESASGESEIKQVDEESSENVDDAGEKTSKVNLHGGDALTTGGAVRLTRRSATPVIVLAGPERSGKTTLLAAMYDRFVRGTFADFLFAGSETLIALEDRCHLARISSGAQVPDIQRTEQSSGTHLLHIKVRRADLSAPAIDLLFADMSGEYYRWARNSPENCRALSILRRADCFVLLVDGARLVLPGEQQTCLREARQLMRRCLEEGMFGGHTKLHVLYTKWDEVRAAELEEQLADVLTVFEKNLRDSTSRETVGAVSFFKVAASPKKEASLGVGYGLTKVFAEWMDSLRPSEPKQLDLVKGQRIGVRECDRFMATGTERVRLS